MKLVRLQGKEAHRAVLAFLVRLWRRRPGLLAGQLVDALSAADRDAARWDALIAFAAMGGLGLITLRLRHVAWAFVVPLSLSTMQPVPQDGFHLVQRLSTDWHANSSSGSTVRKFSSGMWALAGLNDTLLLELLPAFVVLLGTMILLGARWSVMGPVIGLESLIYLGVVVAPPPG